MANHASAKKRIRQSIKRTIRNRHVRSTVRTHVKRLRTAIDPGIILLDTMLPVTDGPSVLNALPKNPGAKATPFVFITVPARPADVAHFLSPGPAGVLPKPFVPAAVSQQTEAIRKGAEAAA